MGRQPQILRMMTGRPQNLVELTTTCWGWSFWAWVLCFIGMLFLLPLIPGMGNAHPATPFLLLAGAGVLWLGLVAAITWVGVAYGKKRGLAAENTRDIRLAQLVMGILMTLLSFMLSRLQAAIVFTAADMLVLAFCAEYVFIIARVTGRVDKEPLMAIAGIVFGDVLLWLRV